MAFPQHIEDTNFYKCLSGDADLLNAVDALREVVETLANTISRTMPTFTDHSIKHMDALWGITDQILTETEIGNMTVGEAFILSCSFYLHDIGMAYAATDEGLKQIRSSNQFKSFLAMLPKKLRKNPFFLAKGVADAVRARHADAALQLSIETVPGTAIYLFQSPTIRQEWAKTCGEVSASHNWDLEKVDKTFGNQGEVPLPGGRKGDLGFVASILRLADFAHINRERAPLLDRAFRPTLDEDALRHWLAQENIDGPNRNGVDLVYRSAAPIENVDAWWLYYKMLNDFDNEIRTVRQYLNQRASSRDRLSLQGVRGATSPVEAERFIKTGGFLPIEINLKTGSIERLVELLAGESLYGKNPIAAVRELIQNSYDAVMLKITIANTDEERATASLPIKLTLDSSSKAPILEISDNGVGMTTEIVKDHLISIASDYWGSQLHKDFPTVADKAFKPAGQFGIGFLSVFMLGDEVNVESSRSGSKRVHVKLRGVGKRGEIKLSTGIASSGTKVRVKLKKTVVKSITPLDALVRTYAPLLEHPMTIDVDGKQTQIERGWLWKLDKRDFFKWVWEAIETYMKSDSKSDRFLYSRFQYEEVEKPKRHELWSIEWPEFKEKNVRLLASIENRSLLSVKGFSVRTIYTPGFVGIIDVEEAVLDVSRRNVIDVNIDKILSQAILDTRAAIVKNLDALPTNGLVIDKFDFIAQCIKYYGIEVILESSLPWITLLKMPGDVELISCAKLIELLSNSNSIFVSFGMGPWTSLKKWNNFKPEREGKEIAIAIDDTPYDHLDYKSGDEIIDKLNVLWEDVEKTITFAAIMNVISSKWNMKFEDLKNQDGWHQYGGDIWGCFKKI